MKFFIVFLIILLNTTNLYSKVGDTYYCVEVYHRGVTKFAEGAIEKNYNLQKFTFKRTEELIHFNENANNSFKNLNLSIFYSSSDETFEARSGSIILNYENGDFFYTNNFGKIGISYVYATCEVF